MIVCSIVVAWLSGSALVLINAVTLRRARLILGWVTIGGQVNHLGITSHLGQLSLLSLLGRLIEYQPFWLGLSGTRSLVTGGR